MEFTELIRRLRPLASNDVNLMSVGLRDAKFSDDERLLLQAFVDTFHLGCIANHMLVRHTASHCL